MRRFCLRLLNSLPVVLSLLAQTPTASAQIVVIPAAPTAASNAPRIAARPDLAARTQLTGHFPGWATPANEAGPAADTVLHLDITLSRAPAIQAAFEQRLQDQQNPTSPYYHVWLTPTQIGQLFGPNQADIDQVTAWLTQQGLHIDEVTPSRQFLRVSAPASFVGQALSTSFRTYTLANGKSARAVTSEPSIPTAFLGVVTGIAGLSDTLEEPQNHVRIVTEPAPTAIAPQTTASGGTHFVSPGDFAILYDVNPVYSSGIDGTGQKIAIIDESNVNPADISNYTAVLGMPAKSYNVVIPPLGADPGLVSGLQGESTLDLQRVIGTAPGATPDLVISSVATGGILTAIQYNVQTLLDPIMTISFGTCEVNAGSAGVDLYSKIFSQAAAEGISVFVSAGDSGAAGCDTHSVAPPTTTQVASPNYICSSAFVTCVGGTEFNEGTGSYWNSTNTAARVSALSPIPEGVWNEPTAITPPFIIAAGGGGVSQYVTKPTFQTGPGVPADGFRDTPDVSFTASGHDSYFSCFAQSGGGDCAVGSNGAFSFAGFYGTSAAAPSMAGVAALLNQKLGSHQGNINPLIYRLANTISTAYNDATIATSGVTNCTASIPSICNNSTPSATALTGGLAGYLLTTGFDLATGWGSLDVNKFISAAVSTGIATTTTLTGSTGNVPHSQTLHFTATIAAASSSNTPTGTVQFFAGGIALGTPVTVTTTAGVTSATYSATNTLANGTYLITAVYSGDSNFDTSNSAALNLTIIPGGTTPSSIAFTAIATSLTDIQPTTFSITVTGTSGGAVPTGTATIAEIIGGIPTTTIYTASLVNGHASATFSFGPGSYNLQATYSGDTVYLPATSTNLTITSTAAATTTTLTGPTSLTNTATGTYTATVTGLSAFPTSGNVTFYDGTTSLGTGTLTKTVGPAPLTGTATFTSLPFAIGTHTLTAAFSGDTYSKASSSAPLTLVVTGPSISLAAAAPSLTFAAGATNNNTDVLTVTSGGNFAGNVALACTVAYNGTGAPTYAPTCGFSSSTLTLAAGGTAISTLTLTTTLPHAATGLQPQASITPRVPLTLAFALFLACLPAAARRRTRRAGLTLAALLLSASSLVFLAGCSSGSAAPATSTTTTTTPPATPVGTSTGSYTITVTANGGTTVTAQTSTIALTVQ